ncbi:hypothetical protein Godav_027644 [Gossypium davidsonii]|uniref:Uncharacterized protein n=1 Tax=Gossypium davidsonii TaxID=34287 RepID=A0A7J8RY74_GOSDV|nr:hypothetical protein [Gossypium davidsonii]
MKDIWNLQPGTRIVVDANQYGQPIRKEASKLDEFLGIIASINSICPLNSKHWKHLSKYVLENILRIVHEKFNLKGKVDNVDILSHVGKLCKGFKSTLKARYYKEMFQEGRPLEEIYEKNPSNVHDDQWKWLAEKEGREPLCLEQFRFQHLHKDGSDKLSSVIKQVYDAACKRAKDFMPYRSPSMPQDNVALENEVNMQVFSHDKYGKVLRYGRGMTKSRLSSYGSIIQGSQSTPTISTLIEEMNAKHAEQIQTV